MKSSVEERNIKEKLSRQDIKAINESCDGALK